MSNLNTDIIFATGAVVVLAFATIAFFISRFRRCPSDKILVIYGRVGVGASCHCLHGGGAFIWPVIQECQYMDLTPIPIEIRLEGALSQQNIRVNVPSTFTVGISTEHGVMENAAERLLGLTLQHVQELAKDIIFGQMRLVIATMPIEEINADRDKLIANISAGVEVELKKIGLRLINVNIQDITDESGYIDALGKEAAARAINDAKKKVAQQERDGEIGKAVAERDQRIQVAEAHATAVEGENLSAVKVAQSGAARREREAEAERLAVAAEKVRKAQAFEEAYRAEEAAERQRAQRDQATQYANVVVPAEIEKQRIETIAEAEAEQTRRRKRGEADGQRSLLEAEALGLMALLMRKADGFRALVEAAGGSAELASLLLVTEKLPELVREQVKAIANLKIDQVTVWEGGRAGGAGGRGSTADFVSGLVGALPPLHELAKNAGVRLPEFLGRIEGDPEALAEAGERLKGQAARLEAVRGDVAAWLEKHIDTLRSFDFNQNNKIDPAELSGAATAAVRWARMTMDGTARWFHAEGGKTLGPLAWSDIAAKAAAGKGPLFITIEGSQVWLPFEVVRLAAERLAG